MNQSLADKLTELREIARVAKRDKKRCALHPEDLLDLIDLAEAGAKSKTRSG
jgi:hypothetical protein